MLPLPLNRKAKKVKEIKNETSHSIPHRADTAKHIRLMIWFKRVAQVHAGRLSNRTKCLSQRYLPSCQLLNY